VALSLPVPMMLPTSLPKLNPNHPVHKETLCRVGKLFWALISELNSSGSIVSFESVFNLSVTAEWLWREAHYLPSYQCAHPYPLSSHNYCSVTVFVYAAALPNFSWTHHATEKLNLHICYGSWWALVEVETNL
jgi:hypothetical protein